MKTLYEKLKKISEEERVSFHVPGHKNSRIYKRLGLEDFEKCISMIDTTEIEGTDNLHYPEGIIEEAQKRASSIYKSEETMFLVSGSTIGVIAMIMSVGKEGDKILVARDCHQSAINALVLSGLLPVYVDVVIHPQEKISMGIDIKDLERKIEKNPDAKGLYLTSPNYYGISSDIAQIAKIIRKNKMVLLVDEAHGAHLNLSGRLPVQAIDQGAHMAVQSTHKSLTAFTQASMLHVAKSAEIDIKRLKSRLRMLQSTSPSYVLMSSLDIAMHIHETSGRELMEQLIACIEDLHAFAGQKLRFMEVFKMEDEKLHDITKIYIITKQSGKTGYQIEKALREKYKIYAEFATEEGMLLVSTIGNDHSDFDKLKSALLDIEKDISFSQAENLDAREKVEETFKSMPFENEVVMTPKEAYEADEEIRVKVKFEESAGLVSGEYIIPYPPGIPILAPGERISKEIISFVLQKSKLGMNITGMEDEKKEYIEVIKCQR